MSSKKNDIQVGYFPNGITPEKALGQLNLGLNPWLVLPMAIALGALVGVAVGGLTFRYGLKGSYFALVTLAFAEVFRILALSASFTGGGVGLMVPLQEGVANMQFGSRRGYIYLLLAFVLLALLVTAWLRHSRFGAYLQAVRDNEDAARAIGEGHRPDPLPERGMGEAAEANRSFNQMVQELERLEADRALMLAGISHDLRTPLARLRLETEMSPSEESVKRDMISDIEQMDEIIGRFLDYARPASRTMQSLDLSDIARETASAFEGREDLSLTTDLADSAPVLAERTDLKRLLTNLIENARKYGRDEQTDIANVHISTRVIGERVEMRVRDTGPGIPEEQLGLVFRPFYRVDTARTKADGTGLGMAIVQRIASRYKGLATLRNVRPGTGLEIIVSFPLAK